LRLLNVTSLDKALQIVETHFKPLTDTEIISLEAAGGRVLAETVIAAEDMPAFNRSIVDGYALRARESYGAQENMAAFFKLAGEVSMGMVAPEILPGECCYVPTGGMLPDGADAVVMLEYTEVRDILVQVFRQVAPGENCLRQGEDMCREQTVFSSGVRLRAPEIGILASLGEVRVKVFRRPRVLIFSSGDELVPPETASLEPGRLRDSNGLALKYLAEQMGADAVYRGIFNDEHHTFMNGLMKALDEADMIVLSGGSSVGKKDFTPEVLRSIGDGQLLIEGLAIQPGKPTLLTESRGKALLGLPGHPISALTVFAFLGQAILRRFSGDVAPEREAYLEARLKMNIPSRPGRMEFVRVKLEEVDRQLMAVPVFGRSGLLHTLAEADGVVRVAEESDGLMAGEMVRVYPWR
jgi:molybdopterin molybdotransferase